MNIYRTITLFGCACLITASAAFVQEAGAQETKDGQTFYEAELRVNGRGKDVLFDANGKVIEIEEQVAFNALPPAVQTSLRKLAGKGRIALVESITKDNALVAYEAHVRTGRRVTEIKVNPEGQATTQ